MTNPPPQIHPGVNIFSTPRAKIQYENSPNAMAKANIAHSDTASKIDDQTKQVKLRLYKVFAYYLFPRVFS